MNETLFNLKETFLNPVYTMWSAIIKYIPQLVSALVVLIIGLIIAYVFEKITIKIFKYLKINDLLEKVKLKNELQKIGLGNIRLDIPVFISKIVKWFFIIVILIAIADILNIPQITQFLERIVFYIPNVIVAIVILLIGFIVSKFVSSVVIKGLETTKISADAKTVLPQVAKWSIILFAFMATLAQLNIAEGLIQILFGGIILTIAISVGIAVGFGGKDIVQKYINEKIDK